MIPKFLKLVNKLLIDTCRDIAIKNIYMCHNFII